MEQQFYLSHSLNAKCLPDYPVDWDTVFVRSAPLAVEIGFGNGEFLIDWATKKPDWNLVGFELSMESIERVCKRIAQSAKANVVPLHEDARFGIRELFPDNSIEHVMMNFPDPWPKDRHKKRRLLDENFADILAMTLKLGCPYELVTDQQWYAEHAFELFSASANFTTTEIELNPIRDVTTKYERKWRELGRSSYRVIAIKNKSAIVPRLLENSEMPHAFVEDNNIPQKVEKLVGFTYTGSDILYVVKDVFTDVLNGSYLLNVVAKDRDYQQNILVGIYRHKSERWIVKLDKIIQPYRTPAVKAAVWGIGKQLND